MQLLKKSFNIFFGPENMKNCRQKLLVVGLDFFFCTGPDAQTAQKQIPVPPKAS